MYTLKGGNMKTKLLAIINHYGLEHQQRKLAEEVFELQQAISLERYGEGDKDHIEEEMADVCNVLMEISNYYKLNTVKMRKIMESKQDRQLERIKNETDNTMVE